MPQGQFLRSLAEPPRLVRRHDEHDQEAGTRAVFVAQVVVGLNFQVIADLGLGEYGPSGAFQLKVDLNTDIPPPFLLNTN